MYPIAYIKKQCRIIANCFIKSGADDIDSDDFAEKIMTSEYGVMILTDKRMIEYSDSNFMYEGICKNLRFSRGKSYSQEVLEFVGYLYKYWVSTRNEQPQRIYDIAPIKLLATRYGFYHTQDIDYVINDIVNRCNK